ncbi:MAG: ABC transporter ATP-binding protein [Firmicutes bacterium]|nr:ABC transporter ATP-binding protein [Candidatus Fermentithermobacillaceae bacterium]
MAHFEPLSSSLRQTWREFKELVSFLDKPNAALAALFLIVFLLTGHAVASAALQRMLVDALLSRDRSVTLAAGLGMVVLEVFYIVCSGWWMTRRIAYSGELGANLRRALAQRVFALGTQEVEGMDRGKFASWSTRDVENASEVLNPVYFLALEASQAIAATAYMMVLDWRLGLLCSLSSPLIVHIGNRLSSPMSRLGERIQASYAQISSLATDVLANRKIIRVFGLEGEVSQRFRSVNDNAYAVGRDLTVKSALLEGAMWFCGIAPLAVPLVYGSFLVFRGVVSLGTVLAITNLTNYTRAPLSEIGSDLGDLRTRLGGAREVLRFLRKPPEETPSGRCNKGEVDETGSITFEGLSFKYQGSEHMALDSVSVSVPSGSCTVVVGESGSGKTTLLKILAGLYPVYSQSGHLVTLSRKKAVYVPQEPFLFPWSIRQNLLLGAPDDGTDRDVVLGEAIRDACAEFVYDLPNGLDTVVSEGGASLSGGQKARLALARALAADPDILLLDEPGASLDARTEETLWGRLRRRMNGKTLVVVTHRLSGVRPSDHVIILDKGRVVASGRHEDLLDSSEAYRNLYLRWSREGETDVAG